MDATKTPKSGFVYVFPDPDTGELAFKNVTYRFEIKELASKAGRVSGDRLRENKERAHSFSQSGNRAKAKHAAVFATDGELLQLYRSKRKVSMKISDIRHAVRSDYRNLDDIDAAYAKACAAEIAQRDALNAKIAARKAKIVEKLKAQTIMPGVK